MNRKSSDRIPIPRQLRWREARLRYLPAATFLGVIIAIGILWHGHVGTPTMTGQAEPTLAAVSSHRAGTLAELRVTRFQRVQAGEIIGRVSVADPRLVTTALEVIRAEIEQLQAEMRPNQRRDEVTMDVAKLRLDYMRQRAELATAQANLQFAESELARTEQLFREKIASQQALDQARSTRDGTRNQVDELKRLVNECEQSLGTLVATNTVGAGAPPADPLRAAISVQEAKLRQLEIEMSPVGLRAPMDGTVNAVYHRPGETVSAGMPVVTIAMVNSARIVGYLRAPITITPRVGMPVKVTTRGVKRSSGLSRIAEVGAQLETIPPVLHPGLKLASSDLGLPVDIAIPPDLKIRPGEVVDIRMLPGAE